MNALKLTAIYQNKWRFYMYPLISRSASPEIGDALKFNWFVCSRPQQDEHGNTVLELDRYTNFFDELTGYTYHITFDATEKDPCRVLVGGDLKKSKELGHCGVASETGINCMCDILCKSAEFIIEESVLEKSSRCPYIEFAKSHYSSLRNEFKNFPSKQKLNTEKPGKFSLKLKKMIDIYVSKNT